MEPIHQRLVKFDREFKHVDLARYYQLKKSTHETIDIQKEIIGSSIYLTIHYNKRLPCPVFDLPPEMMAKIRSYLIYKIELKLKISYSSDYPFAPPIWFMKGVHHTIPNQVDLTDYYCYKVSCHNSKYVQDFLEGISQSSWSPAIAIEKDILTFIQKINHFHEMLVSAW
jgi:hypothetical protein